MKWFKRKNGIKPEDDPTSIGNVLIQMGVISAKRLAEITPEFRKNHSEMFGHFIATKEGIGTDIVEIALLKQRCLRGDKTLDISIKMLDIAQRKQEQTMSSIDRLIEFTKNGLSK